MSDQFAAPDNAAPGSEFDAMFSTAPATVPDPAASAGTAAVPVAFQPVKIEVAEDPEFPGKKVELDACVAQPENAQPGACPLIVLPAPLASVGWRAYAMFHPALQTGFMANLASRGYVVVAYSERGLARSSGRIDVAGPRDQADGTAVLDWAAENLPAADMDRVGMGGASYGAGQSLLIAAKDPRVKAVAAMSAWGDLFESLYENQTRHMKAFYALRGLFQTWPGAPGATPMPGPSRLNPETEQVFQNIIDNVDIPGLRAYADRRSPVQPEFLDGLDRADLAILLCTFWHETIFSNRAVVDLYNKLTAGPKKLVVQIGDHGNGEGTGLAGGPSRPTNAAIDWFDLHLRGEGTEAEPIVVEAMPSVLTQAHRYGTWEEFVNAPVPFALGEPGATADGTLDSQGTESPWSRTIQVKETPAEIADSLIFRGVRERLGDFRRYNTADLPRQHAAIWSSAPLDKDRRISGEVRLRLTVTPPSSAATIVAYLFDATTAHIATPPGLNFDRIITSAAYSVLDGEPGAAVTVDVPFQLTDYIIRAGRLLRLVVDTGDEFLADANADNPDLTISSTGAEPSRLTIPIAELD
ncbi:CocE/NonD family hydrolase [Phytomonospora sp. NPDC050363]|uniref:CocE/NonD family hydrolase n=1 Tax=Phytomonospora sp. NPDC050363 TaxID=3155642 RepID=UPI0033E72AE1